MQAKFRPLTRLVASGDRSSLLKRNWDPFLQKSQIEPWKSVVEESAGRKVSSPSNCQAGVVD